MWTASSYEVTLDPLLVFGSDFQRAPDVGPRARAGADPPQGQDTGGLTSTFNEDVQELIHLLAPSHLLLPIKERGTEK